MNWPTPHIATVGWVVLCLTGLSTSGRAALDPPIDRHPAIDAALAVLTALDEDDEQKLARLIHAPTPELRRYAEAHARVMRAGKALDRAADRHFADPAVRAGPDVTQDTPRPRRAVVTELNDNTARVRLDLHAPTLAMIRVGDDWLLDLQSAAPADPARLEAQVTLMNAMADALQRTASEIADGKFFSREDARAALMLRLSRLIAADE